MEFKVKPVSWTNRALKDLYKITVFNSNLLGASKALNIAHTIIETPKILENPNFDFKNIGGIDDSFNHLKQEYRKIFYKHYKITYRNGKTKIYITRVFDTRQLPSKNK